MAASVPPQDAQERTLPMFSLSPISRAILLALGTTALADSAHADDAFGAYMTNRPIAAARAKPPLTAQATPATDAAKTGVNADFGASHDASRTASQINPPPTTARVASTKPTVGKAPDLVGVLGSPQDNLAREIYVPGSREPGF
jgi:hypothetical protein